MNNQDIRADMRLLGSLYQVILKANNTKENAKNINKLTESVFSGKWLGRKTKMRQEYVQRLDGTTMRICIVYAKTPTNNTNRTGLLWLHGGGYSIGLPEQDFMYGDMFVEDDRAMMILPDYRKSVESPYPCALEDAYLTLVWMIVNAERLGINPNQIFVGGESAGGGLTAALSLFARDEGEINIAFQMPLYPMLDDRHTSTSQDNHAPVWNTELNDANWQFYKNGKEADKYCAPAREVNYANLPPTFTFVGTVEPFYAECKTYMENLYQAGNKIMFREYEGCYHAFDMMAYHTSASKHARNLTKKVFKYAQENFFASQPLEEELIQSRKQNMVNVEKIGSEDSKNEIDEINSLVDNMDIVQFLDDYDRRNNKEKI